MSSRRRLDAVHVPMAPEPAQEFISEASLSKKSEAQREIPDRLARFSGPFMRLDQLGEGALEIDKQRLHGSCFEMRRHDVLLLGPPDRRSLIVARQPGWVPAGVRRGQIAKKVATPL